MKKAEGEKRKELARIFLKELDDAATSLHFLQVLCSDELKQIDGPVSSSWSLRITRWSFFTSYCLCLGRLFDVRKNKDIFTFSGLEKELSLGSRWKQIPWNRWLKAKDVLERHWNDDIEKYRNKRFGHNDRELRLNIYSLPGVPWRKLQRAEAALRRCHHLMALIELDAAISLSDRYDEDLLKNRLLRARQYVDSLRISEESDCG